MILHFWLEQFQLLSEFRRVRVKQRIRSPLFERLFRRISILCVTSRRGGCYVLNVRGALRRMYTLFYPGPEFHDGNHKWKLDLWKKQKRCLFILQVLTKFENILWACTLMFVQSSHLIFYFFASTISIWLRFLEFQSKAKCKNEWNRNQVF
jgi:hypothetical protein